MDSERKLQYVTDAIQTLSGYDATAFISGERSLNSIVFNEDRERMMVNILASVTKGHQYALEYRIITDSGNVRWVSDNGRPVFDDKNNLKWLDGFIYDITERIIGVEELKKAKEAAEEANKAKSEFLANISHEIRTPLNTVLGFAELLEGMSLDQNQRKYINSIKSSGINLMTLINDLLDLSRIEAGKVHLEYLQFNVIDLFSEIRNIFSIRVNQKGIAYIEEIDPMCPTLIKFDETKLRQILINLVGNAIKFTHEGFVKIILKVKAQKVIDGKPFMRLELKVQDTGIGIPRESYNIIFESFRQQSQLNARKYEGTGLGLSITKRLVEAMYGKISLESEVNKGTTFTVNLPNVEYVVNRSGTSRQRKYSMKGSTEKENARRNLEDEAIRISKKEFKKVLDMMHKLHIQWNMFATRKPLKEVKSFAEEIINIGTMSNISFVTEYGEQLNLTIENFDIEEMQNKLDEFPALNDRLQRIK